MINDGKVVLDVQKELSLVDGNRYQLEEVTEAVQRTYVRPKLLSVLMAPRESFYRTSTFSFLTQSNTLQIPGGKAYHEFGPDLPKDDGDELPLKIPSFGLRYNVMPEDVDAQRVPGTMELMKPEQIVAQMNYKVMEGWDAFRELAIAQLLRDDTNITLGGPHTAYNFYTLMTGGARPAATSMQLDTPTALHVSLMQDQIKLLQQEMGRAGLSATRFVVIAGNEFFAKKFAIEQKMNFQREIKYGVDLATAMRPELKVADFWYPTFDSQDGATYINYGSEMIGGTKLIPDDMAYLLPVGVNILQAAYAPAKTLSKVNTVAQRQYAWTATSERQGYNTWTESNVLYFNKQPRAIIHLTV